ncbi:MAG: helix-turn-helix domain-containing protein, partial [Desulfuromonadales bacterium]|nr:helix-turn-helix domain-containing protein [Desulfuromonadales bacterium]
MRTVDTDAYSFHVALDRVFQSTGWRKKCELADFLGIKSQSVSSAKNKGVFPIEWAFRIAQAFNVST